MNNEAIPTGMGFVPFFLQAVTFAMFWIMVPPKRRWRDGVCVPLCIGLYFGMYLIHNLFPKLSIAILDGTSALRFAALMGLPIGMVLVVSWLVCVDTWRRRLLMAVNMTVVFLIGEVLMEVIQVYVLRMPLHTTLSLWTMQILCPIVTLSVTVISATFWNHMDGRMQWRIILLSIVLAASQCTCLYSIEMWNIDGLSDQLLLYFGLMSAMSLAADIVLYQLITRAIGARRDQLEMKRLSEKQEAQYHYYSLLQQRTEEQARFRHDFKNQIQVLYTLSCGENREKSMQLLEDMKQQLTENEFIPYSALPVVNAIVNLWRTRAQRNGIVFDAQLETGDWHIEELDQYILFDKLLGGAVENCRADVPNAQIVLRAWKRDGWCVVAVRWSHRAVHKLEWGKHKTNGAADERERKEALHRILWMYRGSHREYWDDGRFVRELRLRERV